MAPIVAVLAVALVAGVGVLRDDIHERRAAQRMRLAQVSALVRHISGVRTGSAPRCRD